MHNLKKLIMMTILASLLGACATKQPPIPLVPQVDINKFMGPWYVIAAIPTAIETEAYNGIETYKLDDDGTIATTFTFNKGSLNGPVKTYNPRGFVVEGTGNARDYVWIMARKPDISDAAYAALVQKVSDMGYDTKKLRRVPHHEMKN